MWHGGGEGVGVDIVLVVLDGLAVACHGVGGLSGAGSGGVEGVSAGEGDERNERSSVLSGDVAEGYTRDGWRAPTG
jgi:hypothetical protein